MQIKIQSISIVEVKNKTQRNQILTTQKNVKKNAMRLYDKRTNIINAFVNKDIFFENLVPDDLEYEPEFKESVAERIKMRGQKNLLINNQTLNICLI